MNNVLQRSVYNFVKKKSPDVTLTYINENLMKQNKLRCVDTYLWMDNTHCKPKNQDIRCVILIQPDKEEHPDSIYPANNLMCWNGFKWYPADGSGYEFILNEETGEEKYVDLGIEDEIVLAFIPIYPNPE